MVLLGHVGFVSKTQLLDGLLALYDDEIRNGSKHLACFYDQLGGSPRCKFSVLMHLLSLRSIFIEKVRSYYARAPQSCYRFLKRSFLFE